LKPSLSVVTPILYSFSEERLNNQLLTNESGIQRTVWAIVAVLAVVAGLLWGIYQFRLSDPYVRSVLSLRGDIDRGHAIFLMNCAGCHGSEADGRVGPSLRNVSEHKSRVKLIEQVISGKTPPMPQFQPNPKEMADLLSYLEQL
jgi:mono/diheme cytochrome c family protein